MVNYYDELQALKVEIENTIEKYEVLGVTNGVRAKLEYALTSTMKEIAEIEQGQAEWYAEEERNNPVTDNMIDDMAKQYLLENGGVIHA